MKHGNGKHCKAIDKRTRIPPDLVEGMVGRLVHIDTAPIGCVWRVTAVTKHVVHLETPKTKRPRITPKDSLCYCRADDPAFKIGDR